MVDPASALSFLSPPPSQLHLPGKHVPVAICFLSDGVPEQQLDKSVCNPQNGMN